MTKEEFDEVVQAVCPHCAKGLTVRKRMDSGEYVHDFVQPTSGGTFAGARQGHSLCLATHLRNSDLAKGLTSE